MSLLRHQRHIGDKAGPLSQRLLYYIQLYNTVVYCCASHLYFITLIFHTIYSIFIYFINVESGLITSASHEA